MRGVSPRDRVGGTKEQTHASGEKCATQLFTETEVGKASPEWTMRSGSGIRKWRRTQTFGNFDPFDRFIVHGTSARLDELVTFDTKIQYVCALDG